ncbi:MAG: hypothetical protein C0518_12235 [Opitutus sp.]|nr:hypothetical protein [Opitutus sp.]
MSLVHHRSLPRALLLSAESPHTSAAGAIVLHRLFGKFPKSKLLVVTNHLPPAGAATLDCRYEHLPLAADRLSRTRFWEWRPLLRTLGASALVKLERVDALLGGFTPEVVVTLMQDSWFYDLAARYAFARNLPLVLLAHDLAHGFEPVAPRWQARQLVRDRRVARQAFARLCISEPMSEFFQREFGVPSETLLPPRSEEPVAQQPEKCAELKTARRLTLGYAGGLHYGYGEQLLRMIPVLRATGARVEMWGPRPAGAVCALLDATDVFTFHGYAPSPEGAWRGMLECCDAVLQPYLNPAGKFEQQYRTHFPSKLGDALALGLPLLITGPDFASGLRWCLSRGDIAATVTDPRPEALRATLETLRDSPARRLELATQAQAAAPAFDPVPLRARLAAVLENAAHLSADHV